MMELYQLIQLLAIADCGTMSSAAEKLHLSQPALSRSMQKLEEELQVSLFDRQKNKISFNANGKLAIEHARRVVEQANDMVEQIRTFDRSQRTIFIGSCAPAPLWELSSWSSGIYPDMTVSSEMKDNEVLIEGLKNSMYQCIILPYSIEDPDLYSLPFETEQLYFSLPPAHPLSASKGLYFKDIDGETILLLTQIGFWKKLCDEKMPSTHALMQTEQADFAELLQVSALPSFVSNITMRYDRKPQNRVVIPVLDPEATVTYHFVCKKTEKSKLKALIQKVKSNVR